MKKITLLILLFYIIKINALTNIKINNEYLIPYFDKDIKTYNYYISNNEINIKVNKDKNEIIKGETKYILDNNYKKIIINSNIYGNYIINVFKDYNKKDYISNELLNLSIEGYNINFNKDIYDYDITLNNENNLNINYEVNDNTNVIINGNGNFNKPNNLIEIKVGNKIYKIHVHKTMKVSYQENKKEIKEMSNTKKEIVKVIIITISSSLIFLFYKFVIRI